LIERAKCRLTFADLLGLSGVSVIIALPWHLYCLASFPQEFWHEQGQILRHLYADMEHWAAPWDRVVFDYLIAMHGHFATAILAAALAMLPTAVKQRHAGLWLTYAWLAGVLLPHLLATTKTPSATLLALPACTLLVGALVSAATRGERWPLAV